VERHLRGNDVRSAVARSERRRRRSRRRSFRCLESGRSTAFAHLLYIGTEMEDRVSENPKYRAAREIVVELKQRGIRPTSRWMRARHALGLSRRLRCGDEREPDVVMEMFAKLLGWGALRSGAGCTPDGDGGEIPPSVLRFVMMGRTAMGADPMRRSQYPREMCCGATHHQECCLIRWSSKRHATLRAPCSIMWWAGGSEGTGSFERLGNGAAVCGTSCGWLRGVRFCAAGARD